MSLDLADSRSSEWNNVKCQAGIRIGDKKNKKMVGRIEILGWLEEWN